MARVTTTELHWWGKSINSVVLLAELYHILSQILGTPDKH